MSSVLLISDLHLGHEAMALRRGFHDVFYHDEHIIDKWNSVVHKNDLVYILGDITMENDKHYYQLDRLKGRKIVVLGNHDMKNNSRELLKYVDSVAGMIKYSVKQKPKVFLTHCPIHPMELNYRVKYNIHGHLHENDVMTTKTIGRNGKIITVKDDRYINVSCEQVDYTPVRFDSLELGKIY